MLTKLTKLVTNNFGTNHKLIKAIRDDNYNNWERHFDDFNRTANKKAEPKKMKSLGLEVYENNLRRFLSSLRITDDKRNILISIEKYFELTTENVSILKRKFGGKAVDLLSKYRMQDFILTPGEKYEIQLLAKEMGVPDNEVNTINNRNANEIIQKLIKDTIAKGRINDSDVKSINDATNGLGINFNNVSLDTVIRQQFQHLVLINELEKGNLPSISNASIVLQKDEIAHFNANAILLTTKTVTTGYSGGSRGVSIRVMKGISYRVGSSRSTPIRETITMKNNGSLVITNKRVVFNGQSKSFSIGYNQLLSFIPYNNGIGLQKTNGPSYLLELPNFQTAEITFKILECSINKFLA